MKVILVPGAAVVYKGDRVDPDQRFKSRLLSALELYEPDSVIVVSGNVFTTSEGEIGKDYLTRKGIPEDNIIIDTEARDTYENSVSFKRILEELRDSEVHLVTNGFHAKRAELLCRINGIKIDKTHTTEEVLGERYRRLSHRLPISYVVQNASQIKPGEEGGQKIGEIAARIDYITSLFGRIPFHPGNKAIARYFNYDKRELVEPLDFKEWDQRLYPRYKSG